LIAAIMLGCNEWALTKNAIEPVEAEENGD
jgi:hypothetical protein